MKILPVIKNVEWTNNYQDVPKLWKVDKELWLIKQYLGNKDKTIWDVVGDKKALVNSDRINASVIINLDNLKEQLPDLYGNWTIYNLLAVNYFIGNEGQYYFVKKQEGAILKNANTVSFNLELDSWMTNIHDKIINDSKQRYVKKGHANRLVKNGDKYNLDFDRANPNWNEIEGSKPTTHMKGQGFFSSDFDYNIPIGTVISDRVKINNFLNEFNWLVMLVPIEPDSNDKISFYDGLRVIAKDGTEQRLPYQLITQPVYFNDLRKVTFKIRNGDEDKKDPDWTQRFSITETLNAYSQTTSKLLNAGIVKGIFKGADMFPKTADVKLIMSSPNQFIIEVPKENYIWKPFNKEGATEPEGQRGAILKIDDIWYKEGYEGISKILSNDYIENIPYTTPSKVLNESFKNTLPNIFNKEWLKIDLDKDNPKNKDLEPSLYTPSLLSMKVVSKTTTKEISYQLLKGKSPTIKATSSFVEGLSSIRKHIGVGYYNDYKYDDKENILENEQNVYPLGSSKYQDFILQNQSQHQASMTSASFSTAISSILGILSLIAIPFTSGFSAVGAIGAGSQIVSSNLALNEKKAQITDLKRQPNEVRNLGANNVNILNVDISLQNDYLTVEQAVESDFKYYFDEVYENGVLWDFRFNVRWDSRYWFNYWQILDIHKTLELTGLNPDEIELVDLIFSNGVRLWNIRNLNQELNTSNFDKENLEMDIVGG